MPYLKSAFGLTRGCTLLNSRSEYANIKQQREFNRLLKNAGPSYDERTRLPPDTDRHERHKPTLMQTLAPYSMRLSNLGRVNTEVLSLRLTNGPLAGLEIEAASHGHLLSLLIKVDDRRAFERFAGCQKTLETELITLFNRPVSLEIQSATDTTE